MKYSLDSGNIHEVRGGNATADDYITLCATRNVYKMLLGKYEGKRTLGRTSRR
jgi:hypothetical protein